MASAGLWRRIGASCCLVTAVAVSLGGQAPRSDSATRIKSSWSRPSSADSARLLYRGYTYGSDAYYSPLTVLLNKGYDIFQLRKSPRNIWTFPYRTSWKHGVEDIFDSPGPIVERFGGWGRLARIELYPSSTKVNEFNWLVNYTEHLLGGGITMRMLDEWYRDHRVPYPRAWAMATTYAASVLNEMLEQQGGTVATAGNLADLLVFDMAAVLLFHWNQPTQFFARTLQIADWSNQAALTYPNHQLQNNGQYFSMKVPIGFERTRLFIRGGMGAQIGVSRKLDDEHHVSVGAGGDTQVRSIDDTGHEKVKFAPSAGIFYDRNNSLLWSVTSSPAANLVTVNVYPGVLRGLGNDTGLWAVYTRHNEVRFGLTYRNALGLGIGYGR